VEIERYREYWTVPGRWGLLRSGSTGHFLPANVDDRTVSVICEDDLADEVVRRMLEAGVPVIDEFPDPPAWIRLAEDLRDVGCEVAKVEQLPDACRQCPDALPVLIHWTRELPKVASPTGNRHWLMDHIVKALLALDAGVDLMPVLFEVLPDAGWLAQDEVLGGIADRATTEHVDRLFELVLDAGYGCSRRPLIRALPRIAKRHPRTLDVLTRLLDDDTAVEDAMYVLARLHPRVAIELIGAKLEHPDEGVARAAKINHRIARDKTYRPRPPG
jgi:hypothetical protein